MPKPVSVHMSRGVVKPTDLYYTSQYHMGVYRVTQLTLGKIQTSHAT